MNVKDRINRLFQQVELATFFFFLTTSLFLGDGKQPFVDAWWALGILMMYGVRYYQRGKLDLRPLPRLIGWAWTALIFYYIALIPFSDSAGYSTTATIRLIEAYLAYLLFYTISSERVVALFTKGLLFVGVVATLASFIFFLFPSLAGFLPPMNLLYATYGHNHLADLLLMIFPIVITQSSWLLLIFFTTAMFFTFARGAWLLLIFYLLFLVWKSKNIIMRRVSLFIAAVTVGAFLLVSLRGIPTQKPSLVEDGRWEYWRQATEAIKERPVFGSGPGTFYLQSKRLQSAPSSYSWFAHSFPLETTVEVGVVGLFMFIALVCFLFKNSARHPLLWGAVLVFIYSFYEFTLDYAAMWLLVWAALGTLTRQTVQTHNHSKIPAIALIVLVLFYVSSISSLVALGTINNKEAAFSLAPFRVDAFIQYYSNNTTYKEPPSPTSAYLIRVFHKNDSSAHEGVAGYYYSVGLYENANNYFQEALRYDSNNIETHRRYLESINKNKDTKSLKKEIRLLSRTFLSRDYPVKMNEDDTFIPDVWIQLPEELFSTSSTVDHVRLFLAKMYYLYGLALLEKDPKHTEGLWILARDLNPTLSYYHIELASLETNVFHDSVKSQEALIYCQQYIQARKHCADLINNGFSYALSDYPPGYFAKDIRDFPLL